MLDNKFGYFLCFILWSGFLLASLYYLAKILINQIRTDLEMPSEDSLENIEPNQRNPFDSNEVNKVRKKVALERGFGKYISLIAVITTGGFFGIIFFLYADTFNDFVIKLQEHENISYPIGILITMALGSAYMRKLLNGIGDDNEFFDSDNKLIINQRTKAFVMTYLSAAFFALFFAFLGGISKEYNLIKATTVGFIVGNGFYLLNRYNANWKNLKKYSFKSKNNKETD